MSDLDTEVLDTFQDFVEGEQGLSDIESQLQGVAHEEVQELYQQYSDDLAEEDPARTAILESLVGQDELEDQDPRRRPSSPGSGPDPDL